ncbi:hypothetical protein PIB30_077061 [Stylosanthes scabra]|uniref:Uncharacterized protein n=1 Tax=Stylosanthes scabra TaxID=79078 RepID=A0ABU6ZP13_9FABA|nr:hypothetical protein [Stylosanthes scabra]
MRPLPAKLPADFGAEPQPCSVVLAAPFAEKSCRSRPHCRLKSLRPPSPRRLEAASHSVSRRPLSSSEDPWCRLHLRSAVGGSRLIENSLSERARRCRGCSAVFSNYDIRNDVYNRLLETGHDQAVSNPDFRELLEAHFNRLPPSYGLDVNVDRAEDVLLHQSFLSLARYPKKRPVIHVRFLENISAQADGEEQETASTHSSPEPSSHATNGGAVSSHKRTRDHATDFEPWSKLEGLNLDVGKNSKELPRCICGGWMASRVCREEEGRRNMGMQGLW